MPERFMDMLNEPKNTLGRTEEVVDIVLSDNSRIHELYECYFQPDEWVRLRTSSSFKRIWRANVDLFRPFIDGFIKKISRIDQASAQWTFSQMCHDLTNELTPQQTKVSTERMMGYLQESDDWIVQNTTIETLSVWATQNATLKKWLLPKLKRFTRSERKSVARRATKWIEKLSNK